MCVTVWMSLTPLHCLCVGNQKLLCRSFAPHTSLLSLSGRTRSSSRRPPQTPAHERHLASVPNMAEAIEIGKQDVWEKTEAVTNADGTVGVSSFDGFQRLGTEREVLSWPGVHPYIVKTESDEAKAQARLKKEREELRQRVMDAKRTEVRLAVKAASKRNDAYMKRQRERLEADKQQKANEKEERSRAWAQMEKDWQRKGEPGYGPDRWLWPKAMYHPRAYVTPGGDVAVQRGSTFRVASGPGAALGTALTSTASTIGSPGSPGSPFGSPESPL